MAIPNARYTNIVTSLHVYKDMIEIAYITRPIVGAIIGYITNDIAIRMLFRPHQAKFIFGVKIPFTPGIIPKEKGRIAQAIGSSISTNLMNKEVLEKNLLSDDMLDKLGNAVDEFFRIQKNNPETLHQFISHYLSEKEIDIASKSFNDELTTLIYHKLSDSSLGTQIAHIAVSHVMNKMQNFGSTIGDTLKDGGIGSGGGIGKMISRGFESLFGKRAKDTASEFISALAEPVEQALGKNINEMLQNNSKEIVGNLIGNEIEHLMDCSVSTLLSDKDDQIDQAKKSILGLYRTVIKDHLPKILETINISKMIESRINEMDMNETEKIIFQVMDKELKAIVWLGALLGMIMGCINVLI